MFKHVNLFVLLLLCLFSCKPDDNVLYVKTDLPIPENDVFYNMVEVNYVDYDSIELVTRSNAFIDSNLVEHIAVSEKGLGMFEPLMTVKPRYTVDKGNAILHFNFPCKLKPEDIILTRTIRYTFKDSGFKDIDYPVFNYKYPYPESKLFADASKFQTWPDYYRRIMDFQVVYPNILVSLDNHWDPNIYLIDRSMNIIKTYDLDRQPYYFSASSNYIYNVGWYNEVLHCFNIASNELDTIVDLTQLFPEDFSEYEGIDVASDTIYIYYHLYVQNRIGLILLDLDYHLIELRELPLPFKGKNLKIHDGIAYNVGYPDNKINRYNLKTNELMPVLRSPISDLYSIDITDNTLYCCGKNKKKAIFSLPMEVFIGNNR